MLDIIVIGAGLIGSAAAKYLAEAGMDVALVGPDEPESPESGEVFASHYDQGRIVRSLDRDALWSELAQKSMQRFEAIEQKTGILFHTRCGFLNVGFPEGHPSDTHTAVSSLARTFGISVTRLNSVGLADRFPFYSFPGQFAGILEGGLAGYINPRAFVRAQQTLFRNFDGKLIRDVIRRVERRPNGFCLTGGTDDYLAERVLVCAGAWSSLMSLTPKPLSVEIRAETILLVPVTDEEATELSGMPSLWYTFDWHPVLPHVYVVPPVRYPDGRYYIKVGADNDRDVFLNSPDDARRYFRSGGSVDTKRNLTEVVSRLLPLFAAREMLTKPCILTYSASRHPIVREVADSWFVATAGNGAGAKSSDEIGRRAAELVVV